MTLIFHGALIFFFNGELNGRKQISCNFLNFNIEPYFSVPRVVLQKLMKQSSCNDNHRMQCKSLQCISYRLI